MTPLLRAHHWTAVLGIGIAAALVALLGGRCVVPLPLVSQGVPLPTVLTLVSATVCVLPLQMAMSPLDSTFAREARLRACRPLVAAGVAGLPLVASEVRAPELAVRADVARLLYLGAVALVAVALWEEVAWLFPLAAGMSAILIDGTNPTQPVSSAIADGGLLGAAAAWGAANALYAYWGTPRRRRGASPGGRP